jgi:hypothetical protein
MEILGTIDVARNPRQFEDDAREAGCSCGSAMGQKAIVAKAQRK